MVLTAKLYIYLKNSLNILHHKLLKGLIRHEVQSPKVGIRRALENLTTILERGGMMLWIRVYCALTLSQASITGSFSPGDHLGGKNCSYFPGEETDTEGSSLPEDMGWPAAQPGWETSSPSRVLSLCAGRCQRSKQSWGARREHISQMRSPPCLALLLPPSSAHLVSLLSSWLPAPPTCH